MCMNISIVIGFLSILVCSYVLGITFILRVSMWRGYHEKVCLTKNGLGKVYKISNKLLPLASIGCPVNVFLAKYIMMEYICM